VLVKGGARNFIATNKLASNVAVRHVLDGSSSATKVLWSGTSAQLQDLSGGNMSFVATP
jgi:inulin fructotransferase (DFA-I-forming)